MPIDWSGFAIPKGTPRVLQKKAQKLDLATQERICRAAVKRRDKGRCVVPGCKEHGQHLHHIVFRSQSKAKRWLTSNCCLLCAGHHQLLHNGLIAITGNADDELTITGEKQYLEFRL